MADRLLTAVYDALFAYWYPISLSLLFYSSKILPKDSIITLAGLSNLYTHYVTTFEEYQVSGLILVPKC